MAANVQRRQSLCDAAIDLLAEQGARGLSFRSLDDRAGVPNGTASNYFASRSQLVSEVFGRIGERLSPSPERLAELAELPPTRSTFKLYMLDILERVRADSDAGLALFELRLYAARDSHIAPAVREWLHTSFAADVAFNTEAGLPAGPAEIAMFHYAIDGLLLDQLTEPIEPNHDARDIVADFVDRLLGSDPTT